MGPEELDLRPLDFGTGVVEEIHGPETAAF